MIHVDGLVKTYGRFRALDGLSFDVAQGEIFGFVGPNGAGKTTSMRILAALMRPSAGTALVDGIDVVNEPGSVRMRIGYMPDFFGVYDQLSTAEYLAFYASCYRVPRSRIGRTVTDLLELIGLPEKRDLPVDSLSRGMKQRLCLARALVHDPAVLLLDEPASGLDPRARVEMRELLRELQAMGKTIVVSSHILPELAEMCTRFGIIDGGRMVATGPIDRLLDSRNRRRVRVTVADDANAAAARALLVPGVHDARVDGQVVELEHDGGEAESSALLTELVKAGITVRSFMPVHADLEQIFLETTRGEATA
jgi:ABC-2 type transport system ATP-binding protein